jgi:hypothetical protein
MSFIRASSLFEFPQPGSSFALSWVAPLGPVRSLRVGWDRPGRCAEGGRDAA